MRLTERLNKLIEAKYILKTSLRDVRKGQDIIDDLGFKPKKTDSGEWQFNDKDEYDETAQLFKDHDVEIVK